MRRRHPLLAAFVALGAVAAAACQPVTTPPPPPPPPPQTTTCAAPVGPDGKTEYFAVVDQGGGTTETVTFDAGSEVEKRDDVAAIEATEGDVVAVEIDWPVRAAVNPDPDDDPRFLDQWGVTAAGFPTAWDVAHAASQGKKKDDATPIKVAVLDTGIRASHEDLGAGPGAVVAGSDFSGDGTGATADGNGHGTHVAGILGARDNTVGGVGGAPDVEILSIKVLNSSGSGSYSSVIDGINEARIAGARIISMSLGGAGFSQSLQNAVTTAVNVGVVVIAAAGNDGTCTASYPAALNGVISVAATTYPGTSLAAYSQRGPGVDIAAPGSTVLSTLNTGGYGDKSGTSMATPFVAAAAALLIAKCPGISPSAIETRLESNTTAIAGIQPGSGALRADLATAALC